MTSPAALQRFDEREVERLSSVLHDIYQKEAHRQEDAGIGSARHYDEYEKLSEPVKEFDRVLARYILSREAEVRALIEGMRAGDIDKVSEGEMRDVAFNLANQNLVFGYNLALADILEKLNANK